MLHGRNLHNLRLLRSEKGREIRWKKYQSRINIDQHCFMEEIHTTYDDYKVKNTRQKLIIIDNASSMKFTKRKPITTKFKWAKEIRWKIN